MTHMNPHNFCNMSWIFGTGKGFLLFLLLSSLKSANYLKVPSGFEMVNIGAAHAVSLIFLSMFHFTSLSHSILSLASCDYGTGYGLA